MRIPTSLLVTVVLVVPLVVGAALYPIIDTGANVEFGSPRAFLIGAVLSFLSILATVAGAIALSRDVPRVLRAPVWAGTLFGVFFALLSVWLLWFFRPE